MKKRTRAVLGIALALCCLAVAFRGVNFGALWEALAHAEYRWLFPAMACVSVSMLFRVFRWGCLLSPTKRIGFMDLFSAISICFMANNVLPARSGEVIRAVLIGKKHGVSIGTVLATVVLERVSDALCVMGTVGERVAVRQQIRERGEEEDLERPGAAACGDRSRGGWPRRAQRPGCRVSAVSPPV